MEMALGERLANFLGEGSAGKRFLQKESFRPEAAMKIDDVVGVPRHKYDTDARAKLIDDLGNFLAVHSRHNQVRQE